MATMMRVMRARAFAVTSSSTASRGTARGVTARRGRAVASRATRDGEGVSDLAAMDAVIDLMLEAKSEEEVGKIVVENVLMFDQKMWMRFASRSDTAEGSAEKTRIMELAGACMKLVEAMVEKTENTMEEASVNLQTVVGAAADPSSGEFDVPLNADALARMKTALESVMVDERTLNTLYAWIRKSDENGLDGMVHILQRLLQLYAARELDENSSALDTVIRSNAEEWQMHFIDISKEGYNETAFTKDLQRRMEGVVLNLPNGSYAQRVQAEYLKEIEDRGKEFFAQQA
jgi:flagellar biosynthesis regulator FlaF|tara:strand:- start:20077 stop:20943 length:867 start_codon:yes stop_codon:yes gene_type:complete